jgi:hypothetical protein
MNNEVENHGGSIVETPKNEEPKKGYWRKLLGVAETCFCLSHKDKDKWLDEMKGYLGLMATVIATMTFQTALNPPGGIRSVRDDKQPTKTNDANNAYATGIYCGKFGKGTYWDLCPGEAVIGATSPDGYSHFLLSNTICFVASLSVCLLFVSGIPLNHRFPIWILSIGMCITLTSLAVSYMIALGLTAPSDFIEKEIKLLLNFILAWIILLAIIGLWHILRLVFWGVKFVIWGVKHFRKRASRQASCIRSGTPFNFINSCIQSNGTIQRL